METTHLAELTELTATEATTISGGVSILTIIMDAISGTIKFYV